MTTTHTLEETFQAFCVETPGIGYIAEAGFIVGSLELVDHHFSRAEIDSLLLAAGDCFVHTASLIDFSGPVRHGARVAHVISMLADRREDTVSVHVRIANSTMALGVNLVTARDDCGKQHLHVWPWMTTDIDDSPV